MRIQRVTDFVCWQLDYWIDSFNISETRLCILLSSRHWSALFTATLGNRVAENCLQSFVFVCCWMRYLICYYVCVTNAASYVVQIRDSEQSTSTTELRSTCRRLLATQRLSSHHCQVSHRLSHQHKKIYTELLAGYGLLKISSCKLLHKICWQPWSTVLQWLYTVSSCPVRAPGP